MENIWHCLSQTDWPGMLAIINFKCLDVFLCDLKFSLYTHEESWYRGKEQRLESHQPEFCDYEIVTNCLSLLPHL